jgi:hypothetical protein
MRLNPIRANLNEIDTRNYRLLISYETPVAYFDRKTNTYHKTSTKWSNTTTRHIKEWVAHLSEGVEWFMHEQSHFDDILLKVK